MSEEKQSYSSEDVYKKFIEPKIWTQWYDEDVPKELEIPEVPLFKLLDDSATHYPDRVSLVFFDKKITYALLNEYTNRFSNALKEKWDFGKNDVVALFLPNSPQFVIAYYGSIKTGATVTPINPLYTSRELARQLKSSNAKVLITLDIFKDRVDEAVKETNIQGIVYTGIDDFLPGIKAFLYRLKEKKPKINFNGKTTVRFKEMIEEYSSSPPKASIDPKEDVVALMFTGGTTGTPKSAMLTHYNLVSNVYQIDSWLGYQRKAKDVMMGLLPWFHIYGQTAVLHTGLHRAATIIVLPRFQLEETLKAIVKYKANIFHAVPTIYSLIVNKPDIGKYDLRSIEACISGAAPLPVAVAEKFEKITGGKLREGYGLTETSPVTHVNPIYGKYKFGSIGVPVPNTYAAIAHPEEPIFLPPGETGELVISGPQVMKGYYNAEEENKRVFFEAFGKRWFRTGDMAKMDEEGYFYIIERKKDLIKYKGYSVYPREIEEVLYNHECIAEAAVVGVPDPNVGERIKAFVVIKNECKGKVNENDIIEYCKQNLAPFKVPKEVEFRDSLPKTTVGKILRRVLKEEEMQKMK